LQQSLGITINGVILVSTVLDMRTLTFQTGDDISYVMHLPSYAAIAWYHNKIANRPANLDSFVNEARAFAGGEYAAALLKGASISDGEKDSIATKLATFTGLSKEFLLKANLRVMEQQFTQELLRDEHMTVGTLDSRYKSINQDLLSEFVSFDPLETAISSAFTATFMNYYYGDLKVDKKYTYHTNAYTSEGFSWDWKHAKNVDNGDPITPNTGVDLAEAMSQNPNLKVLVLNGYFDLATPFYATEFTFNHLGLEKNIQKNITFKYYRAGHMMYINPAAANYFKTDVADFITGTHK
jgi:carboxypeptidase C (cathepsin A)